MKDTDQTTRPGIARPGDGFALEYEPLLKRVTCKCGYVKTCASDAEADQVLDLHYRAHLLLAGAS